MIPSRFVLNGREWTVELVPKKKLPKKAYGVTHFKKARIRIDESLPERERLHTFYHELFHAFLWTEGILGGHDEAWVERFGSYLLQYEETKEIE